MSIIKHLNWRYATKKFDASKTLTAAQLNILTEAFNLTALSYGLQTLKLVVIKDRAKREALVAHSYGQRQVADASHLFVICIQNDINSTDVEQHFETIKAIRATPDEVLKGFKTQLTDTIEGMSETQKATWATKQAYIALGNLMTVCAVEGIDSCPMEGFLPEQYNTFLGLDKLGLSAVLVLPVGFRAEDDFFADLKKVRKTIAETVIEL